MHQDTLKDWTLNKLSKEESKKLETTLLQQLANYIDSKIKLPVLQNAITRHKESIEASLQKNVLN